VGHCSGSSFAQLTKGWTCVPELVCIEFRTVGFFWIGGLLVWLSGLPEFVEDLEEVVTLGDGEEVGVDGVDFDDEVRVGVGVGVDRSWA
jgi:hypothetical protein